MRGKQLTPRSRVIETARVPATTRMRLTIRRLQALRKRNYVEDLAIKSDDGLITLSQNRKWLFVAVAVGLVLTALVWAVSLSFPYAASSVLWTGVNLESRLLTILVMLIPFTPPFVTVFALSNLMFPSAPEPDVALGVMSTFEYRQTSDRRWFVIVVSAMFGVLNCLLLGIALASATGN
jgi:predicted Abi (CAAX) family protease